MHNNYSPLVSAIHFQFTFTSQPILARAPQNQKAIAQQQCAASHTHCPPRRTYVPPYVAARAGCRHVAGCHVHMKEAPDLNAGMPVIALPRMSACTSWVPS